MFFRHIGEQGHYAGRTKPSPTRQGLYITGVDGNLLASLNSTDVGRVLELIKQGLAKWESKRSIGKSFRDSNEPDERYDVTFPEGGIVLRQTMRDLPDSETPQLRIGRHNFDHVWLTADQKKGFLPSKFKVGHVWKIPDATVRQLAAFHLIDQVRGESWPFDMEHVKKAKLLAKVAAIDGDNVTIQLKGEVNNVKPATHVRNPYNGRTVSHDIVINVTIRGWLTYDNSKKEFESFKLLAAGKRSGSDVYNSRWKNLGPSSIGFAFEMVEDIPSNRIRPKFADQEAYKGK